MPMLKTTRATERLDLAGRCVLVLGLGVNQGGVGVVRYLCAQGADVRVTDMQGVERLAPALAELSDLPVRYTLERHDAEDIRWAEVVVRNPGVPRESEWLELARSYGARVEMEMTLFLRACPGPIFGVTGTKGKTTASLALHTLLSGRHPGAVLAGNMGRSALTQLDVITSSTPVVLELSSFQLEGLEEQRISPEVAVITNIHEDHLDRYVGLAEYAAVKAAIARNQDGASWLIVNRDDRLVLESVEGLGRARRATFGHAPSAADNALWIDEGRFTGRWHGSIVELGNVADLRLPGEHARLNVLAAACAALAAGMEPPEIAEAIERIEPLRDRLELVGEVAGVRYVNDTTATVPAAAIAALHAFDGPPLIVIAGGSDKRVALDSFANELARRAERVILLAGSGTSLLEAELARAGHRCTEGPFNTMAAAVERAAEQALPGTVVLLSPGCASFGMFRNEFHRGEEFRTAVARLAGAGNGLL